MLWFNDKHTHHTQNTVMLKYVIPIFVISIIFFSLFFIWEISFLQLIAIVITWSLLVYTFINIFIQTPHVQIPEYYPKWLKTIFYILHFLMMLMLFYLVFIGITYHYYPFLEKFVCCDLVRNFPKF